MLISGLEQSSDPCQDTRRQDVIAPPETMLLNKAEEQIAQVQEAVGLLSRQWEYGIGCQSPLREIHQRFQKDVHALLVKILHKPLRSRVFLAGPIRESRDDNVAHFTTSRVARLWGRDVQPYLQRIAHLTLHRQISARGHDLADHLQDRLSLVCALFVHFPLLFDRQYLLQDVASNTVQIVVQQSRQDLASGTDGRFVYAGRVAFCDLWKPHGPLDCE